jgi:hypothetical protein
MPRERFPKANGKWGKWGEPYNTAQLHRKKNSREGDNA